MAEEGKKPEKSREVEIKKATPAETTAQRALSPFEEMDRLFDQFFHRGWMRPFHLDWPRLPEVPWGFEGKVPKVDVIDRDDEVVVKAELPGVEKDDIELSLTDNTVTIKGSTMHEEKEERGDYYRSEISRGSFSRTVSLPAMVDGENAKASFKHGVLTLELPKIEESKRKKIEID